MGEPGKAGRSPEHSCTSDGERFSLARQDRAGELTAGTNPPGILQLLLVLSLLDPEVLEEQGDNLTQHRAPCHRGNRWPWPHCHGLPRSRARQRLPQQAQLCTGESQRWPTMRPAGDTAAAASSAAFGNKE